MLCYRSFKRCDNSVSFPHGPGVRMASAAHVSISLGPALVRASDFILKRECHSRFKFYRCLQLKFEQVLLILPISCGSVALI
jgi:hypothetical protein